MRISETKAYILVSLILFVSARSSFYAIHFAAIIVLFIYTSYYFFKISKGRDNTLILITIFYITTLIFYFINFGQIDLLLSLRFYLILLIGYFTIYLLGLNFLLYFERLVYPLVLISLSLFLVQIFLFDELVELLQTISQFFPGHIYDKDLVNIFVFSIDLFGGETRNSGFAWEPKGFANFLVIAFLVNLLNNNLRLNKRGIVYFIALITTFSTTAYLIIFILFPLFILWNKKTKYAILSLVVLIPLIYFISELPFISEKIKNEWEGRYEYEYLLSDSRSFEKRSLGRFPSLMLDTQDFLKEPIIGYGMQKAERTQSIYTSLIRVNGLSDWLATFGLFGIIFYLYAHYKGIDKLLTYYNKRGVIILLLIIFVIYFATTVTIHPFWITLLFFFKFNK